MEEAIAPRNLQSPAERESSNKAVQFKTATNRDPRVSERLVLFNAVKPVSKTLKLSRGNQFSSTFLPNVPIEYLWGTKNPEVEPINKGERERKSNDIDLTQN